jgi:hypothetical protein
MITQSQQQQLEKYVNTFQRATGDGADPQQLQSLLPEFYHFVDGCKAQVKKTLEQNHGLKDEELRVAEGLLENLDRLQSSLLETSRQLGIALDSGTPIVTADHKTLEIRINFEQCNQDSLKNILIQAIRDTLNVEAPLANAGYSISSEPDHSILVRVIHNQEKSTE